VNLSWVRARLTHGLGGKEPGRGSRTPMKADYFRQNVSWVKLLIWQKIDDPNIIPAALIFVAIFREIDRKYCT
jgi:hypothetical protein